MAPVCLLAAFIFSGRQVLAAPAIVGEVQGVVSIGASLASTTIFFSASHSCSLFVHAVGAEAYTQAPIYPNFYLTDSGGGIALPKVPLKTINSTDWDVSNSTYRLRFGSITDLNGGRYGVQFLAAGNIRYNIFCLSGIDDFFTDTTLDRGGTWGKYSFARTLGAATSSLGLDDNGIYVDFFGSPATVITAFQQVSGASMISNAATTSSPGIGAVSKLTTGPGNYTTGINAAPASTDATGYHYSIWVPSISEYVPPDASYPSDMLSPFDGGVGCESLGRLVNFSLGIGPNKDGFNYDIYASSSCVGNEIASSSFNAWFDTPDFFIYSPATFGSQAYCMRSWTATSPEYYDEQPFSVIWYASTSAACMASNLTFCDDPCDGVATTTAIGEINCGLRSFAAWAVCPSENYKINLANAKTAFFNSFPMNIGSTISEVITTTTTAIPESIKIPYPRKGSSTNYQDMPEATILTTTSIPTLLGSTTFDRINDFGNVFLTLAALAFVIFLIL